MEKQQVALEETLLDKRMTPDALEAAGGSSRSKQCLKLALAAMGLLIVALVTALIYCFLQRGVLTSCDQSPKALPASDPAALMTNCKWKESDHKDTYDVFTADDTAKYLVYGWVKFSEAALQELTPIHFDKNDHREVGTMRVNQAKTVVSVFGEMQMIKNTTLSLRVPGKLKLCTDSRFHVYKL